MTFGGMGSYAILNPYDVPYLPLKFVPLITNHPYFAVKGLGIRIRHVSLFYYIVMLLWNEVFYLVIKQRNQEKRMTQ